ncbi:hypothetical protein HYQ46_006400 [Verticillium longisporum]|nr:hypothetical protein HYQ46_006400 [Verticillium longisporum]
MHEPHTGQMASSSPHASWQSSYEISTHARGGTWESLGPPIGETGARTEPRQNSQNGSHCVSQRQLV